MNVALIGAGNMGISWAGAALLAGHDLTVVDKDPDKLIAFKDGMLFSGEEAVWSGIDTSDVTLTEDLKQIENAEIVFIAVQTPSIRPDDSEWDVCDFSALEGLLEALAPILTRHQTLILGSTVFPGTIKERILPRLADCPAAFVYQPVFLRAGTGVTDFLHPPKVILGTYQQSDTLQMLTKSSENLDTFIRSVTWNDALARRCSYEAAEFIKLMHNTFMCLKLNFANELGALCDEFGVDPTTVTSLTFDESNTGRLLTISHMRAGPPFSGTCLPKDSAILNGILREHLISHRCPTLATAHEYNHSRVERAFKQASEGVESVGVIGMGYRPDYSDARHSLAVEFNKLAERDDIKLHLWDPKFSAMDEDAFNVAARQDAQVIWLYEKIRPKLSTLLASVDSVIVNLPYDKHVVEAVRAFKEKGGRVIDLYRTGV